MDDKMNMNPKYTQCPLCGFYYDRFKGHYCTNVVDDNDTEKGILKKILRELMGIRYLISRDKEDKK